MTTREAFEAYIKAHQSGDCWNLWQAATDAALERAADEVSIVDSKTWFENQSMFGVACRKAIRALKDAE
jgi:hypothetical protein